MPESQLEDLTKRNKTYASITKDDLERYAEYGIEGWLGFPDGENVYHDKYKTTKNIKVAGEKYLTDYILEKKWR